MEEKTAYLVVMVVQFIYAGMYVLTKAAFNTGVDTFVFVFYRQAAATVFIAPAAIISGRITNPPLGFTILLKIFLLVSIGITFSLNLYSVALSYTSATVASAVTNSVPVITFFLAVVFRMEKMEIRSRSGVAKFLGITLCLGGVMAIAFYTGTYLPSPIHSHPLRHGISGSFAEVGGGNSRGEWVKGTFLIILSCGAWSLWLVLQILFTAIQCLFSSLQSFLVAVFFQRDLNRWKLRFDVGLLAVAYSGVVVTGVSFYLQTWCIEKRGPVFLAVFTLWRSSSPSSSSGCVLGGLLMVGGLYSVLWGKLREEPKGTPPPGGELVALAVPPSVTRPGPLPPSSLLHLEP
ncbi:unnamed protein product [Spirodela intermedia]|uniref:WAT1-related protein n=1 Tax=Spirodela intermedia TaxID=51605 RepID=A0A7I8J0M5_SPIIN|nr:unnamed protein product [Spirodela intermedia]CAA6663784.1 unnamed protein product [Spirodela intermedia]